MEQIKINRIKISNYRFFYGDFEINDINGNLLIYGENGSGKSSLYKAFELLASGDVDSIETDKNIFCDLEYDEAAIEFGFSNGMELTINPELYELPTEFAFIRGLSVFTPMLDYKKLLKVHYTPEPGNDTFLYDMLKQLLKNYPVVSGGKLSDIRDFTMYIQEMDNVLNHMLLDDINDMIEYFNANFSISGFVVVTEIDSDGRPIPKVKLNIDFYNEPINNYYTFLNEARLTALAISIYFASIKKMLGTLSGESLKILVLDDLLISLDMRNRLMLFDLLKSEFADFQIFFFTHDKNLFDYYIDLMDWDSYELLLTNSGEIPSVFKKKGSSDFERAKHFFSIGEYDICGNLLRKSFEKIVDSALTRREKLNKDFKELKFWQQVQKLKEKSDESINSILDRLIISLRFTLNPASHCDERPIYSEELKSAMDDIGSLNDLLR